MTSNVDPAYPLVDLHRHLEGAMRLSTILELAQQHGIPMPSANLDALRPYLQAMVPQPGLMAFIEKIDRSIRVLVDADACRRVAYECVEDAAGEGIDYVEVRFSPRYMAGPHGLDPADVVAAVIEGTHAAARDHDIRANLIGILSRTYGLEACWEEFEALRCHHEHITAMDIAGDEAAWPAELFAEHFRAGRDLGWSITAHAGEAAGPESIWIAIQQLGATRIGHGLHAIEDPALMDFMAEHTIALEVSLTSNVQISAVPDYASHPIKTYVERGIPVTLNTDDPAVSRITLAHEYDVAAPAAGLTREEIHQIQRNALSAAFLDDATRTALEARKRGSKELGTRTGFSTPAALPQPEGDLVDVSVLLGHAPQNRRLPHLRIGLQMGRERGKHDGIDRPRVACLLSQRQCIHDDDLGGALPQSGKDRVFVRVDGVPHADRHRHDPLAIDHDRASGTQPVDPTQSLKQFKRHQQVDRALLRGGRADRRRPANVALHHTAALREAVDLRLLRIQSQVQPHLGCDIRCCENALPADADEEHVECFDHSASGAIACTGQTCIQTVQPVQSKGSIAAFRLPLVA